MIGRCDFEEEFSCKGRRLLREPADWGITVHSRFCRLCSLVEVTREGRTEVEERQLYTQAIVGQVMCLMRFFEVYLLQLLLPCK